MMFLDDALGYILNNENSSVARVDLNTNRSNKSNKKSDIYDIIRELTEKDKTEEEVIKAVKDAFKEKEEKARLEKERIIRRQERKLRVKELRDKIIELFTEYYFILADCDNASEEERTQLYKILDETLLEGEREIDSLKGYLQYQIESGGH